MWDSENMPVKVNRALPLTILLLAVIATGFSAKAEERDGSGLPLDITTVSGSVSSPIGDQGQSVSNARIHKNKDWWIKIIRWFGFRS
jgi:hypothetical protein